VIAWVERQYGVISRAQLLALGVPSRTIQGWRLAGLLHDLHPGATAGPAARPCGFTAVRCMRTRST
jgi:hypothetical protein